MSVISIWIRHRRIESVLLSSLIVLLSTTPSIALQQDDLTYSTNDNEVTITGYTGAGGAVNIPSTIAGLPVTTIGTEAFAYHGDITSVSLPDSVTALEYSAFWDCDGLTTIDIPDSVTTLGFQAFASCVSLTNAYIGNGLGSISAESFRDCSNLVALSISGSVTYIGSLAFYKCASLTRVYFQGDTPQRLVISSWTAPPM